VMTRSSRLAHPPSHRRDREAHLLAQLLRTSRLTLLFGEAGAGKTTLLQSGVLPLLRRRAGDRVPAGQRDSNVAVPFSDRRVESRSWGSDAAEVAIFFDRWNGPPLVRLHAEIRGALSMGRGKSPTPLSLADDLAACNRLLGVRFLIIFDAFEEYLATPADREGVREFTEEFVEAMNRPFLPANVLISLREDAQPLLNRFRERILGFDNASLRLPSLRRAAGSPLIFRAEADAPPTPMAAGPPVNPAWAQEWRKVLAPEKATAAMPAPVLPERLADTSQAPPVTTPALASPGESVQSSILALEAEIAALMLEECGDTEQLSQAGEKPSGRPAVEVPGVRAMAPDLLPASPRAYVRKHRVFPELKWFGIPVAALLVALLSPSPPPRSPESPVVSSQPVVAVTPSQVTPRPSVPALAKFESVRQAERGTNSHTAAEAVPTVAPAADIDLRMLAGTQWSGGFAELLSTQPAVAVAPGQVTPQPSPPGLTKFESVTQGGSGTNSRIAGKLAPTVAPAAEIDLTMLAGAEWSGSFAGLLSPQPAFALAPTDVTPPPSTPARAKFEIVTDAEGDTDSRIASELARTVAPVAGIDLGMLAAAEWSDSFAALLSTQPRLAIVRYDALQTLRISPVARKAPFRIVTPLYTEEIYFIARADSPLQFIHEIKDRRINIGPIQSSRGLTAATLYQHLFGTSLTEATFLGDAAALRQLVTDKTIDVMVVIAAQPVAWLADLPPATGHAIKLLKMAPTNPASRRALKSFLPVTVHAASYRAWLSEDTPTLGVMAFLVTSDLHDAGTAERLGAFAQSLCRNLPALQRNGHPKWREVSPGVQLEAGWPYSAAAEAGFRSCLPATPQASNS
jgi:uncharacterized protein